MKHAIAPFFFLSLSAVLSAQTVKTIKGTIKDSNGEPVSGAQILVQENNSSTQSNRKGGFEMALPVNDTIHLSFSQSGYENSSLTVDTNSSNLNDISVTLNEYSTTLAEVIVTAEKRQTKLQKTPIAVSSISAKDMEQRKMTEVTDLVMTVPNLMVSSGGSPTLNAMSIRGIITFSTDPAIGVFIDGIPVFDGYAASTQLQDIERVEVLRGPQGTLYGRSALGGVINILTKQPGNFTKGFAEMGFGNFNFQEYRAGISTPLIKNKLFFSANGFYTGRKGVYTNEYTGKAHDDFGSYGGNFYLKYLVNDRLSFTLNSKIEQNDIKGTFAYAPNYSYALQNPYKINQNGNNIENRTLATTSLLAKYQLTNWELSSLTGYSFLNDIYDDYDYDYSPYDITTWSTPKRPQNTVTQEFKAVSKNLERWNLVGGIFGFIDNRKAETETAYGHDAVTMYPNAPFSSLSFSNQNAKGFAAYAHATYAFTDRWSLTAGIRYDYDQKKLTIHDEFLKEPDPAVIDPARTVETSANAVTPKFNIAYLATDDITIYSNYAKGFRPGGVNQYGSAHSNHLSFEPEYTDNYEVGVKTEWFKKRLRANFAVFYTYWKDQQQTIMVPEMYIDNIGEMYSKGFEMELSALPLKNLEIHYNLGYIHTKYNKLLLVNESGTDNEDYKGNRQIFTPDFSSSLSLSYNGKITKKLGFFVVPEWKYIGKQYMTYYNDLVQEPFHLININAGLRLKNYELKFWVKNLTDSRYISYVYANYRAAQSPTSLALPTTFGASAKITF